jgi:hypothetical protein
VSFSCIHRYPFDFFPEGQRQFIREKGYLVGVVLGFLTNVERWLVQIVDCLAQKPALKE